MLIAAETWCTRYQIYLLVSVRETLIISHICDIYLQHRIRGSMALGAQVENFNHRATQASLPYLLFFMLSLQL